MGRILVVDDEAAIVELIAVNLRHDGHEVRVAHDAEAANTALLDCLPDLVLLDWMLPGEPGVSLARRWRAAPRTKDLPIVMLTARPDRLDIAESLDAGADDCLAKPFTRSEMMARVRAVLRRSAPEALDVPVEVGLLRLDPGTRRVHAGANEITLGPTEFRLLRYLMNHPETVHSRTQLLDRVWGVQTSIEERTVDVHVMRLRSALKRAGCADLVETVRGAGYRLATRTPARA